MTAGPTETLACTMVSTPDLCIPFQGVAGGTISAIFTINWGVFDRVSSLCRNDSVTQQYILRMKAGVNAGFFPFTGFQAKEQESQQHPEPPASICSMPSLRTHDSCSLDALCPTSGSPDAVPSLSESHLEALPILPATRAPASAHCPRRSLSPHHLQASVCVPDHGLLHFIFHRAAHLVTRHEIVMEI